MSDDKKISVTLIKNETSLFVGGQPVISNGNIENEWNIDSVPVHDGERNYTFTANFFPEGCPEWVDLRAYVKWDGCVELWRYFNAGYNPKTQSAYDDNDVADMHICDLDQMIERLTKLRDLSRTMFPKEKAWEKP